MFVFVYVWYFLDYWTGLTKNHRWLTRIICKLGIVICNLFMARQMLSWRSFPVVDEFPKSILLSLLPVIAVACFHFAFKELIYTIIAIILLGVTLRRYYLPTFYTLTQEVVETKFLLGRKRVEWHHFKNFYVHKIGVFLSPFEKPSYLDPFRGIFLRYYKNRDEVINFVRSRITKSS